MIYIIHININLALNKKYPAYLFGANLSIMFASWLRIKSEKLRKIHFTKVAWIVFIWYTGESHSNITTNNAL